MKRTALFFAATGIVVAGIEIFLDWCKLLYVGPDWLGLVTFWAWPTQLSLMAAYSSDSARNHIGAIALLYLLSVGANGLLYAGAGCIGWALWHPLSKASRNAKRTI